MLDDRGVELLGIHVFAGAGVEDHGVQISPVLGNLLADFTYRLAVGQVASHHQYLPGIAQGQDSQRRQRAGADGQVGAGLEYFFGQRGANAAARTGQPVSTWRCKAHPVLLCSQAIARPHTGRCSYWRSIRLFMVAPGSLPRRQVLERGQGASTGGVQVDDRSRITGHTEQSAKLRRVVHSLVIELRQLG
ncbi:hypothetical protein D3C84_858790 [compost metagenome]